MSRFEAQNIARRRRVELLERIQRFVDDTDTSQASVALIEAGLDDAFPDNDRIADVVHLLAQYRPGGGESFVGESEVRAALEKVLAHPR